MLNLVWCPGAVACADAGCAMTGTAAVECDVVWLTSVKLTPFDKDLKNVLMEKADGTVRTKVVNGEDRGGVYI